MTPSRNGLANLTFDNRFTRCLPGDPEEKNFRRQVSGACYSRVMPTPAASPELVAFSREAARLIGLDKKTCRTEKFARVFTGNEILAGMDPFAMCSEAMFHLGVPTTRALSLTTTGTPVERDMFYDGHPKEEPGAVVCRLSPSFTRFGNFQILAARQEAALLKQFMDYTIETDFPHLDPERPDIYETWYKEVCTRTVEMVVHWMRVGFVHGVMNTDNMSILGLTIDYGPYGWLEGYDPDWTPNTTDAAGRRYAFGNQPGIALWNLGQLANAILPVTENAQALQQILDDSLKTYEQQFLAMMTSKLGIQRPDPVSDPPMIKALFQVLGLAETDYTLFFRGLSGFDPNAAGKRGIPGFIKPALYHPETAGKEYEAHLQRWLAIYARRLEKESLDPGLRKEAMAQANPKVILRNYLVQQAIDKAEKGDFSRVWELLDLARDPYGEQPENEKFAQKRPEWARHKPGCSMLSCSS